MTTLEQCNTIIAEKEGEILKKVSNLLDGEGGDHHSLNGIIGGKNEKYHTPIKNYSGPANYIKDWLKACENSAMDGSVASQNIMYLFSQDEEIKKFFMVYLLRTYLKKHRLHR